MNAKVIKGSLKQLLKKRTKPTVKLQYVLCREVNIVKHKSSVCDDESRCYFDAGATFDKKKDALAHMLVCQRDNPEFVYCVIPMYRVER